MVESSVKDRSTDANSRGAILYEAQAGRIHLTIVLLGLTGSLAWLIAPVLVRWPFVSVHQLLYVTAWVAVIIYGMLDTLFVRIRITRNGVERRDYRARTRFYTFDSIASFEKGFTGVRIDMANRDTVRIKNLTGDHNRAMKTLLDQLSTEFNLSPSGARWERRGNGDRKL